MLSIKYSHEQYQSFVHDFLNMCFIRRNRNRIIWTLAPLFCQSQKVVNVGLVSLNRFPGYLKVAFTRSSTR